MTLSCAPHTVSVTHCSHRSLGSRRRRGGGGGRRRRRRNMKEVEEREVKKEYKLRRSRKTNLKSAKMNKS